MDYAFTKEKLHPGASYPLKRSELDEMLQRVPEGLVAEVAYRRGAVGAVRMGSDIGPHVPSLRAHYVGLDPLWRYDHREPGEVVITVWAIRSQDRSVAESLLRSTASGMVDWLARITDRSATWREQHHEFDLYFARGAVGEREDGESRYPVLKSLERRR